MKRRRRSSADQLMRLQRVREMGWSLGVVLIPIFTVRFFQILEFFGSAPTALGLILDWIDMAISAGLVWVGVLCIAEALKIDKVLKDPALLKNSKFTTRFLEGGHWVVVFPFYFRY